MLANQRKLFSLPDEVVYLNGAYMSPILKASEEAGCIGAARKSHPYDIYDIDFFNQSLLLKQSFAKLIHCADPERIAIIPSAAYGISTAAQNIDLQADEEIVVLSEQFPSNYYPWQRLTQEKQGKLIVVAAPISPENRAQLWNQRILDSINERTAVVAMCHNHWTDGTLFDLRAIREKTRQYNALLVIDASQSIGALPFDQSVIQADAVVCAGYKWLLGPYGIGMAYFGDHFDEGLPLEDNWINKVNSEDFSGLVNYQSEYKPKAARYSVGEHSRFIHTPMLQIALDQLMEWKVESIQQYCRKLCLPAIEELVDLGCSTEQEDWRASHLFGIRIGDDYNLDELKGSFAKNKVFVSIRGSAIRISPNVYNRPADLNKLIDCFKEAIK